MRQDEVWKAGYGYENLVKNITYTYQNSKVKVKLKQKMMGRE